jgi:uncharacterized damage-inducible protein DinB
MLIEDDFDSLYEYNTWADERTLAACRALSPEEYARDQGGGWPSVRETLVHLASATDAWHRRFHGESPERLLTGADMPAFEDAAALLARSGGAMKGFVLATPAARRQDILTYTNLQGQRKRAPYWAIFRHVVNHATYHRGQISAMIRRLGREPKPTDLILWAIVNTPQE